MGTFTPELTFGEYSYGTMAEDPGISYKTLIYSGFSPLSLFAASEPGFWFDPSDISTLFQDTAGTTPVTAAGQSVGLVLDKSKGLVLGPELVTNGDFSGGTTGWLPGSGGSVAGTLTVSGGVGTVTVGAAAPYFWVYQSFTTVVGRTYKVTGSITGMTGGSVFYGVRKADNSDMSAPVNGLTLKNSVGSFTYFFTATATTTFIALQVNTSNATASFDNLSVSELPGNHATQSNALQQPTYQVDSNGRGYLLFDGSDDSLVTGTITPGTDKAQVFAGVRKLSDAAQGVVAEWGAPAAAGAFTIQAPSAGGGLNRYLYTQYGSAAAALPFITNAAYSAPHTAVFTGYGDIAADVNIARINGVQAATSATNQGTGNFSAAVANIGRRNGSTLPFNGRIYGLICRFGPNLTATQITQVENWMNGKTGAY